MSRTQFVDDPESERILDLAEDALDRGEVEAALGYCDQVLGRLPDHPGALYLSAEAHHELGEFAEAEQRKDEYVSTEHLLLAIAREKDDDAARALRDAGVIDPREMRRLGRQRALPAEWP